MDDKLFDIFSEETTVPKCVLDRIDETLDTLEGTEDKKKETRSTGGRTNRKNWKRSLVLSFAAVMAFGATVFAAEKYMGISSFFSNGGARLSKEAQALIENEPVQQEDGDSILTFTVKEALCDKNSVQVVVEVTAKERGKYLLAGQDALNEDPVRNLGIESDKTIEEYAAEKGLTIVKVGASFDFDSDLGIETAVGNYRNLEDDVVDFYSSAVKTNESKNLTVSCIGTATLPDAKCVDDVMRTNITFQLEDKSQKRTVTYVPKNAEDGIITADGKVKILSVEVEESEIGEYAAIHYIVLGDASNIALDVTDANGNLWNMTSVGGSAETTQNTKEGVWKIMYEKTDLPDEIGIRAYDYENSIAYEPVMLQMS